MKKAEKIKLFYSQLRGNGNPTAEDIRNAASATGDVAEIIPEISLYAAGMGIDASVVLNELSQTCETAMQEKVIKETAVIIAEKSKALIRTTDKENRRELIKGIRKDVISLEPSAKNKFQFIRIDSLEVRPPSWLVKGLIETDSFGCLYGVPSAGKSFIGIELSSCVATGTPFYGMPVKKGAVIHIAGEGQSGIARRFKAWEIARGILLNGAPLYMNQGAVSLIDDNSMVNVVHALERLILEIGCSPTLVILDTWSRLLGGDDSLPSDAAAGVAALDKLRSQFDNFAAIVVHHEGHTQGRSRGWSGLRAAVDIELRATCEKDDVVRLECTKSKDTKRIEPMAFLFMPVELPIRNDSGEPVTSAVLTPTDWTPAPKVTKKKRIGKNQVLALDILRRLTESGEVKVDAWRKACLDGGMERQRFNEAKKSLVNESGIVEINNLIVTVCE